VASVATGAEQRTPWFGTRADQAAAVAALGYAAAATGVYVALAWALAPELMPKPLEVLGTVTSLACVWITRRQNVLCMLFGLVSVMAMGIFFFEIELVGQGWLHLGYYVPVQFVGWWLWVRGGEHGDEKPVSWLSPAGRLAVLIALVLGTFVLARAFEALHGPSDTLLWDASIVAASVAAQWLLTIKRAEAWLLWLLPVDVSAILLYLATGAYLFAALYTLYLVLASLGLRDWVVAWRAQEQGLPPGAARMVR
jgi:nicotinamide mononucleotide transporter